MRGRKRHIVVDTQGHLLRVWVHAADLTDRTAAAWWLEVVQQAVPTLQHLFADGGYSGALVDWARDHLQLTVEIVKKLADQQGFVVLPKRWIVERTFAWLGRYRRLSKDYEATTASSEAWITIAMIHLMLRRLEPR